MKIYIALPVLQSGEEALGDIPFVGLAPSFNAAVALTTTHLKTNWREHFDEQLQWEEHYSSSLDDPMIGDLISMDKTHWWQSQPVVNMSYVIVEQEMADLPLQHSF